MDTLRMTNYIIAVVFFVCYAYQFLYIPVPWLLAKRKAAKAAALEATPHNYAVLICARNESAVIADLIGSLRSQTYDQSLLHIFVLADNCTDDTAAMRPAAPAPPSMSASTTCRWARATPSGLPAAADSGAGRPGRIRRLHSSLTPTIMLDPNFVAEMNRTF